MNSLEFLQINDLDSFNCEIIGIKLLVRIGSTIKHLHIFSIYQPPPSKINNHKLINPEIFEYIQKNFDLFLIGGDLNAKLTCLGAEKNNENGKIMENIIADSRFIITNDETPTFHLSHRDYSSVLDLFILSNNLGPYFNQTVVFDDDITSDHLPIQIDFDFDPFKTKKVNKINFDFKKAD